MCNPAASAQGFPVAASSGGVALTCSACQGGARGGAGPLLQTDTMSCILCRVNNAQLSSCSALMLSSGAGCLPALVVRCTLADLSLEACLQSRAAYVAHLCKQHNTQRTHANKQTNNQSNQINQTNDQTPRSSMHAYVVQLPCAL